MSLSLSGILWYVDDYLTLYVWIYTLPRKYGFISYHWHFSLYPNFGGIWICTFPLVFECVSYIPYLDLYLTMDIFHLYLAIDIYVHYHGYLDLYLTVGIFFLFLPYHRHLCTLSCVFGFVPYHGTYIWICSISKRYICFVVFCLEHYHGISICSLTRVFGFIPYHSILICTLPR